MRDDGPGSSRSLVPARLDRLPWARFHTRLVVALGITWVLDGIGGATELVLGVPAEGMPLEDVCPPLSIDRPDR